MKHSVAKKVAFMGLLFALAIAFSYFENLIPPLGGMPPGIKLGLSNIVTMFCLFFMSEPWAFSIVILKSVFTFLLRGFTAAALSFAGGMLSVAGMLALLFITKRKSSVGFVSIAGAIQHNIGQILLARFLLKTNTVFFYLPLLIVSGVIMGSVTGLIFIALKPYLQKLNALSQKGENGKILQRITKVE